MPKEKKDRSRDEDEFLEEPDAAYEPEDEEYASAAGDKLKKLREKLKACEKERADYLEGWQRARADLVNFKRRVEEEEASKTLRAKAQLLESILPVLDSFEMAMAGESWQNVEKDWRIGVEQICNQLKAALRDAGLTEEDPTGKPFDPSRHDSLRIEPTNDKAQDGVVVGVIQKGYLLQDTLIRPAKVVVGEYKDGPA